LKKIAENGKNHPCLCTERKIIIKRAALPKSIYRLSASKFQHNFYRHFERTILNFIWKNKKTKQQQQQNLCIAKTILNNKVTAGCSSIPDFKFYKRAIIIKITWYQHQKRHINKWNQIKGPNISSHS
jgi:hypothetical protein